MLTQAWSVTGVNLSYKCHIFSPVSTLAESDPPYLPLRTLRVTQVSPFRAWRKQTGCVAAEFPELLGRLVAKCSVHLSLTEGYGFQREGQSLFASSVPSSAPKLPQSSFWESLGSFEEWEYCKVTFFQISSIQTTLSLCLKDRIQAMRETGSGHHLGLTELVTTSHPSQVKRHHTTVTENISLWV